MHWIFYIGFYFWGKYIYTDGDEKEVERDMYAALPYFQDSHDGYENWENNLEEVFNYFSLTSEQKYHYIQRRLVGQSTINVGFLRNYLRNLYAPYSLYASEADYNVEQEPEPESRSFANICTEFPEALERYVASQAAKIDTDPEPTVLVEPKVADKPEPTVAKEPEPEIKEPLIETSPVVRVPMSPRSPDLYVADLSTWDRVTGDHVTHGAKYNWFGSHSGECTSVCYMCIARVAIF